jgi:hypothetical protein
MGKLVENTVFPGRGKRESDEPVDARILSIQDMAIHIMKLPPKERQLFLEKIRVAASQEPSI